MNPDDRLYTKEHEWVKIKGNIATVGITDYAQKELTDIVYVELPNKGIEIDAGDPVCTVESVKNASDVFSPVSGKVVDVNRALEDEPELVNSDPYGKGWMVKIEFTEEPKGLMNAQEYEEYLKSL
jgi:glycine cleavage system H protein